MTIAKEGEHDRKGRKTEKRGKPFEKKRRDNITEVEEMTTEKGKRI